MRAMINLTIWCPEHTRYMLCTLLRVITVYAILWQCVDCTTVTDSCHLCADLCSTGGSGSVVCGDSSTCPYVVKDGACLAGGELCLAFRPVFVLVVPVLCCFVLCVIVSICEWKLSSVCICA